MKSRLVYVAALLLALVVCPHAHAQSPQQDIRAVLDAQVAAWNRADVAGFMDGYDKSPDTTFVGSRVTKGWQAVLDRYRQKYTSAAQMGTLRFGELDIRPLSADVAVVTGHYYLTRDKAAGGDADGLFSLVFVHKPAGWRIVLDHTS